MDKRSHWSNRLVGDQEKIDKLLIESQINKPYQKQDELRIINQVIEKNLGVKEKKTLRKKQGKKLFSGKTQASCQKKVCESS